MVHIKKIGVCRGAGKAFIKIRIEGPHNLEITVCATTAEKRKIPVSLYPFDQGGKGEYVVELPLVNSAFAEVSFFRICDGEAINISNLRVNYDAIKWESRFNYRFRKKLCAEIRDYGDRSSAQEIKLHGLRYLDKEEEVVWRFSIEWMGLREAEPFFRLLDTEGVPQKIHPLLFEEQDVKDGQSNLPIHKQVFYSIKLPASLKGFILEVNDKLDNYSGSFLSVDACMFEQLKYDTWKFMKDARADDVEYQKWFEKHRAGEEQLAKQKDDCLEFTPLISIVIPCFESQTEFLRETIDSVLAQSYTNWELLLVDASPNQETVERVCNSYSDSRIRLISLECNKGIAENTNAGIKESRGEYIAFLDHDDFLEPNTLYEYVSCINENRLAQLLYCDEDMFCERGEYIQPVFKTQLNVDLLYSHNCVTHLLMIAKQLLNEIGFMNSEVDGAQDYDIVLRAFEAGAKIVHIPQVLYHWRQHEGSTGGGNVKSKPYAEEAGRVALGGHLKRRGISARVEITKHPFVYRVKYDLPNPQPEVSIVIPSKDHSDVLNDCIQSIIKKATYSNYKILIVENNSVLPETFEYYEAIQEECESVKVVTWVHEFNYSKIINYGAAQTTSEYLLFLNNDTKVISSDFIEEMLGYLQRPEVGIVGAKLYFRDDLVQHAGMLIGPYGAVAHVNQDFSAARQGYLGRAVRPGNFSSVTGACQMVKRQVFDKVGGYSEELAVGFNDVDFCLKVWEAGYRVVFTPYAELYHYEFVTRGRETADADKQFRWKSEREYFEQTWPDCFALGDPFTNPNLDRDNYYYALPEVV